jgi:hypothetical protein
MIFLPILLIEENTDETNIFSRENILMSSLVQTKCMVKTVPGIFMTKDLNQEGYEVHYKRTAEM